MKKPLVIGITGGIGGGKSTLARLIQKKSFFVYQTDTEARRLQNEDPIIVKKISDLFGKDIYTEEGLDRKKLGEIVFKNSELLTKLNEIVHPIVKEDFSLWKEKHNDEKFLFIECAILLESSFKELSDIVLLVTAPEDVRIQRVIKRDGLTVSQVYERMSFQMPEEEKRKYADIILDSNGENALEKNILTLFDALEKIEKGEGSSIR